MNSLTIFILISYWIISIAGTILACIQVYKKYKKDPTANMVMTIYIPMVKRIFKRDMFWSITLVFGLIVVCPFIFLVVIRGGIKFLFKRIFKKKKQPVPPIHDPIENDIPDNEEPIDPYFDIFSTGGAPEDIGK